MDETTEQRLPRDRWVGASPGGNVTPGGIALEKAYARIHELEDRIKLTLEAVDFGHAVTPDSRLYRELRTALGGRS